MFRRKRDLQKRVDYLEQKVDDLQREIRLLKERSRVYPKGTVLERDGIPFSRAFDIILNHLGLRLVRHPAEDTWYSLEKKEEGESLVLKG